MKQNFLTQEFIEDLENEKERLRKCTLSDYLKNLQGECELSRPFSPFSKNERAFIKNRMKELSNRQFTIVFLHFWKDLDAVEIAKALKVSVKTVIIDMDKALTTLRDICLNEYINIDRLKTYLKYKGVPEQAYT